MQLMNEPYGANIAGFTGFKCGRVDIVLGGAWAGRRAICSTDTYWRAYNFFFSGFIENV